MEMGKNELLKSGTTTIGMVCKDGIVLAADKRATMGNYIADRKAQKIHQISKAIAITIAGNVADAQLIIKIITAQLKLEEMRKGRLPSVKEAASLLANIVYSNIRKFSTIPGITHFLIGGSDSEGFHLYEIFVDGSTTKHDDFVASGSGSPMVWGYLENLYKKNMEIEEVVQLAIKSLNAAIQRDSASGSGIDIIQITKDGFSKILEKEIQTKVAV
ncbi:MAG: proteasome subunit beta [Nanoarchaeota archaeon]|nr:proteasome subunit beta [Nanoarchaeota archaeon]